MILKDLGLSAWITDSEGDPLPEYQVKQLNDNTIECWIPSSEGTNFEVRFKGSKDTQPKLDLECRLFLDGLETDGGLMGRTEIARGEIRRMYRHAVDSSTARLYLFGRRELTDGDDDLLPGKDVQEHLNTIRLEFTWGIMGRRIKVVDYVTPELSQPIHERVAKKGHAGSVKLGRHVPISTPYMRKFDPDSNAEQIVFIFRYAPTDWLKAQEIAPRTPGPEVLEPGSQTGQTLSGDSTQEIIDVEDLETDGSDDDGIVTVKHMIPAPSSSKQKRHESQAHVKEEENEGERPKRKSGSDDIFSKTSKSKRRKIKAEKDTEPKLDN